MFTVTNLGGCVQTGVDYALVYISAYDICYENRMQAKRLTRGQGHLPTLGERTLISYLSNQWLFPQASQQMQKQSCLCLVMTATFLTFNAFPQHFVSWSRTPSPSVLSFLIWSLPPYCSTSLPFGAGEVGTPGFSYSFSTIKSLRDDNDCAATLQQ